MGAHDIGFEMKGSATQAEVNEMFRNFRDNEERSSYGWKSVSRVKFTSLQFETAGEAYDYCMDHAEKWDYVLAVKFKRNGELMWLVAGWGAE